MLALLAQVPGTGPNNLFEVIAAIFARGDTLAHPQPLIQALQSLSVVWGTIFLIAGVTCLLLGSKYYRTVTVILALMIGAFAGYMLGQRVAAGYIVAGCLAALLAVACWPLMKYAVAAMGGLAGAFLGANIWSASAAVMASQKAGAPVASDPAQQTYWVGALLGLIICGMLAFVLFKLSVVLFTSVSGATVAVFGGLGLMLQVPTWQDGIRGGIANNAIILPLLVFVPALIGLILQETNGGKAEPAPGGGKPAPKPA